MQPYSRSFSKHGLAPLAAAVLALSVTGPAAAQDNAPGWLNWGGSSEAEQQDPDRQEAQPRPVADESASQAPTGQAALLQRLMRRVDALETEVRQLRGQVSEQERALQRQQREHEQALRELESRQPVPASSPAGDTPAQAPADDQAPESAAPAASAPDDADSGAPQENGAAGMASDEEQQALYNEAFEILKSGEYEQAVAAFQKVIDANPQGSWASSAFFWQGETYYVQRDYNAAAKSYAELIERYPNSNRVPDATLKLGYIAQEQDRIEDARARFNAVIEQYPDSQAAGLAKQRLGRLGG